MNTATHTDTTAREIKMYGCIADDFVAQIKASITYRLTGGHMVVAGLMSDAQEEMTAGNTEAARLTLNRAKLILFMIADNELVGTAQRN